MIKEFYNHTNNIHQTISKITNYPLAIKKVKTLKI
jgi:hypothetical protein